jgi:facilitated trehalose transporter
MTQSDAKLLTETTSRVVEAPKIRFRDALPQIVASCAINLVVIQAGINMAFSSILIPQLSEPDSDIQIDLDSSSNLASIVTISIAMGALVCGSLMDRFGRVKLATFICVPFTIGWLLIVLSRNLLMIYVARVLSGFCGGLCAEA